MSENNNRKKPIVITVANNKGGVGKTTAAAAFAHLVSQQGKRVLLVDTDPQGNCAQQFGIDSTDDIGLLGELLLDRVNRNTDAKHAPLENYIVQSPVVPEVDVLSGGKPLNKAVYTVIFAVNSVVAANVFRKIMKEAADYDYVIVDTSPSFSSFTDAVFMGTDWLLAPLLPDKNSIDGVNTLFKYLAPIREEGEHDIRVAGVFFNQANDRSRALHEFEPLIREGWKEDVLKTKIPVNPAAVAGAINDDQPVTLKYPVAKATKAYKKLVEEVIARVEA